MCVVMTSNVVWPQEIPRREVDGLEKKLLKQLELVVRFERVDTTVEQEGVQLRRSYYFDQKTKKLVLITAYENQQRPRKGFQLHYTFVDNQLVKASVIPSRMACKTCRAEYYFSNDKLVHIKEAGFYVKNVAALLEDSRLLSSKFLSSSY